MSRHVDLALHLPEETVTCDTPGMLVAYQSSGNANPISEYFATTGSLVRKLVDTKYANDAEIMGLLVLGVVSSAEFYFRSILSALPNVCPLCETHTEGVNIPAGSVQYYAGSGFPVTMSAFEHVSLADIKTIAGEIRRFGGFSCMEDSSVKRALEDFEVLCEVRHCLVHARGFAGLKATRAIGGKRIFKKLLIRQQNAFDLIKLAHNAVRAVNRYLSNQIVNQWIEKEIVVGNWKIDRKRFMAFWKLFHKAGEDQYAGSVRRAYSLVRRPVLKRQQALATNVGRKRPPT